MPLQFDESARAHAVAVADQGLNVFVISRLPTDIDLNMLIPVSDKGSKASIDDVHQARVWAEKPSPSRGRLRVLYYEPDDQAIPAERFAPAVAKLLKDDRNVRSALGITIAEVPSIDIVASDSRYAHHEVLDDELRHSPVFAGTGYIYMNRKSASSGLDDLMKRFFDAEIAENMDISHILGIVAATLKRKLLHVPEKDLSVSERLEMDGQKALPDAVEALLEEIRLKSGWGINVFVLGPSFLQRSPDDDSIARLTGAVHNRGGKLLFEYPVEDSGNRKNDESVIARFMSAGFDGYRFELSGMRENGLPDFMIGWIEGLKQKTDLLRPGSWVAVVPPPDSLPLYADAVRQLYARTKIRTVVPYVPGEFPLAADESTWPELRFERSSGVSKTLYLVADDDQLQQELGALLGLDSPVVGFDSGNGKYIDFSEGTGTVQYLVEHLKERIKKLEISVSPDRIHENARKEALRLDNTDVPALGNILGEIILLENEYDTINAAPALPERSADDLLMEKYASLIPADSGREWNVVRLYVDHFLTLSRNASVSPAEKRAYTARIAGFFAGLAERYQLKSIRKSSGSILPAAIRSLLSAA
jgi:hypothetical protein